MALIWLYNTLIFLVLMIVAAFAMPSGLVRTLRRNYSGHRYTFISSTIRPEAELRRAQLFPDGRRKPGIHFSPAPEPSPLVRVYQAAVGYHALCFPCPLPDSQPEEQLRLTALWRAHAAYICCRLHLVLSAYQHGNLFLDLGQKGKKDADEAYF